MIWYPTEAEKAIANLAHELGLVYGWLDAAEQRLHLTAIAACGLGVLIGLCIGWLWFGA